LPRFEILCVTMHQSDFSKVQQMNLHSDVVFANQCERTAYEERSFDSFTAKMISTQTRGVGINRNLSLIYATAEICLFADDDVVYHDDMEQRVVAEFDAHPDADVIIFHLDTDSERRQISYPRTRKHSRFGRMPWGGCRIAFRRNSVLKANLWFTTLFGGGCIFPSGEDSMWLTDARKAGLTFYVSSQTIGTVSMEESSWFTGRDEKYFFARGAYYTAMHPGTAALWMWYAALSVRANCSLSLGQKRKWMQIGAKCYKKMESYAAYCQRNSIG